MQQLSSRAAVDRHRVEPRYALGNLHRQLRGQPRTGSPLSDFTYHAFKGRLLSRGRFNRPNITRALAKVVNHYNRCMALGPFEQRRERLDSVSRKPYSWSTITVPLASALARERPAAGRAS